MEDIRELFKTCRSIRDLTEQIFVGEKYTTHRHRLVLKRLRELGLDPSIVKERYRLGMITTPTYTKECPVCETTFETKVEKQITCGYSCSNTFFNGKVRNTNLINYRSICFRHHKKECIVCGETKIVEAHHYDGNRENNLPSNLIPLCPNHHQYYHSRYRPLVIDKIEEFHNKISSGKIIV